MIVRINCDRIDRDRRQERIIGRNRPRSRCAAAVRCFPNAPTNACKIGVISAVAIRDWIDRDIVHAALGLGIVVATGTAGHLQWRRTERCETVRIKDERRIGLI